jgi:hypothetical protein
LNWVIDYYRGNLPLHSIEGEGEWDEVPTEGVVFVTFQHNDYSASMGGYDNYWKSGVMFGCYNDPEHEEEYGLSVSYYFDGKSFVQTGRNLAPPYDALIIKGVQMPDHDYMTALMQKHLVE